MLETIYLWVVCIWLFTALSYLVQAGSILWGVQSMGEPRNVRTFIFIPIPFWIEDNPHPRNSFNRFIFGWYRLTNIGHSVSTLIVFPLWLITGNLSGSSDSFEVPEWNFYGYWLYIVLLFIVNIVARLVIRQIISLKEEETAATKMNG